MVGRLEDDALVYSPSPLGGVDPGALVEAINAVQAERTAARAEINNTPTPELIDTAEVYARIDMLGDVPAKLTAGGRLKNSQRLRGHEPAGGVRAGDIDRRSVDAGE